MSDADADEDDNDVERRVVKLTAESYGALDATLVNDECWIVRMPQKLAELWQKAPEGTDLGELVFTKGGATVAAAAGGHAPTKAKPSFEVRVSEELAMQESSSLSAASTGTTIPLKYSLQAMTKRVPFMVPFIRRPNDGSIQLLGTVTRTANLQVEQDDRNYRAMLKDRMVATNITSQRFVKSVEASESVIAKQQRTAVEAVVSSKNNNSSKGFGDRVLQIGKHILETSSSTTTMTNDAATGPSSKKARLFSPSDPIRTVVFQLFGQQPYWNIKELKGAAVAGGYATANSKKADAEIRDVLREIGIYHRSGDYKSQWELKEEFRNQHEA
jgi:hypothetical protein